MLTLAMRQGQPVYLHDEALETVIKVTFDSINRYGQPVIHFHAPQNINIAREKILSVDELAELEACL
jgi:sRNA-binding carbon storage regulator CsrA